MYTDGPFNIVHLQSKELNKDIYLLFDVHADKKIETHCRKNNSIDIVDLLNKVFHNTILTL